MEYEIVKYSPEFKSQIVELQKHLWSPDAAVNAAYFEWKYERNPYLDTPLIYLALCAGKVVGMRGIYGAKWQVGNPPQILRALCAGDLVIAPDHRNQGLYTKIMRAALNDLSDMGYKYVFNLSANPVNLIGSLTMGWRSVGNLQTMRRKAYHRIILHRLQSYANKLPFLSPSGKRNPFHFLDKKATKHRGKATLHVSIEQTPRPKAMAELVERTVGDGRIRQVRDQEYFSWRFGNPLCRYRFLFWEGSGLEGYLILQTKFNNDTLRVNIVDWEAANPQTRSDLLQATLCLGNFDALSIWTATLPDVVKVLLEKNGFRLLSKPKSVAQYRPTLLVRPVRDDMLKSDWVVADCRLLDLANWDLRMIYSDGS